MANWMIFSDAQSGSPMILNMDEAERVYRMPRDGDLFCRIVFRDGREGTVRGNIDQVALMLGAQTVPDPGATGATGATGASALPPLPPLSFIRRPQQDQA